MGTLKERKAPLFLKAFVRFGKVWPAARAARISRDAIYDWLRNDPSFRRDFEEAKRVHASAETAKLSHHLDFFCAVVRPVVPPTIWPRIAAAVNLAVAKKTQFKKDDLSTVVVLSRRSVRFSMPIAARGVATSVGIGNRDHHQGKNERRSLT
jgi:hypothetical protein